MKKIFLYPILAGLGICGMASCKKASTSGTPVSADVKAAFSYNTGTYWLYKDSVTNNTDSFAVVSRTDKTIDDNAGGYVMETDAILVFRNGIRIDGCSWTLFKGFAGFSSINGYKSYSNGFLQYPYPAAGTTDNGGYSIYTTTDLFPSYSLNGQAFNMVSRFLHTAKDSSFTDVFYVSKDAGIIKMALHNPADSSSRVLELQGYKIVH